MPLKAISRGADMITVIKDKLKNNERYGYILFTDSTGGPLPDAGLVQYVNPDGTQNVYLEYNSMYGQLRYNGRFNYAHDNTITWSAYQMS